MRLFGFSILYLFALFAAVIAEAALGLATADGRAMNDALDQIPVLTPQQASAAARATSRGLVTLGALVILFFAMTIVRLGGAVSQRF